MDTEKLKLERKFFMAKAPAEMMREFVRSQNFTSTDEVMTAMKDMFKDILQEVIECELSDELGYEKSERMSNDECGNKSKNYRNGYSKKTVKTQMGELEIKVPRDRNGEYEPKIISINIEWSFLKVLLIITVIPFATLIYTGIKTATAAIAFWTKRSGNITYMFYMVNDFAKYPITIYNNIVRNIITYIIPFAFTAFYPAYYILSGENPLFNIGMTVLIAIVMMVVGVIVWNRGIRSYESAGS